MRSVSTLIREIRFAWRCCADFSSFAKLAWNSLVFHATNRLGIAVQETEFAINMRLRNGDQRHISLRRCAGDVFVFYEVFDQGCYHLSHELIEPESVRTIVDCGANVGMTSLFLAEKYPSAKIYSIEPDTQNFSLLAKNALQVTGRITPVFGAIVGLERETVAFAESGAAWGRKISVTGNGASVPAWTIEKICDKFDIEKIDLLKIDIEGAEKELFSNPSFLTKVQAIIIELHDDYSVDKLIKDLHPFNFEVIEPDSGKGLQMVFAQKIRNVVGEEMCAPQAS